MQDTFRQQGLRKRLVQELRGEGIQDENVLKAIEKIPRHFSSKLFSVMMLMKINRFR